MFQSLWYKAQGWHMWIHFTGLHAWKCQNKQVKLLITERLPTDCQSVSGDGPGLYIWMQDLIAIVGMANQLHINIQ